ncbi:sugar transferase [Chitiniphilus purpureus]|uniref:Sugar transferase n=1 Tax=Chitiniphilus purpureus TaxID=2981137 RepID=A0ABY6DUQ9_9NEIS|nr:sugar transferase [Chitiniphilus sp. CD1]UXY15613.1 sugar transferase [Chitiniphilus sp. CD1]
MVKLAPIALFAYKRPAHTRLTLDALAANPQAQNSNLHVYLDGAKGTDDKAAVAEVAALIEAEKTAGRFQSVTLTARPFSFGLARNIIEGVTEVCRTAGRVIVLEDDIQTAPDFLDFMNRALKAYEHEQQVWHISGWNYPIDDAGLEDAFFWRAMNCWGWATWWGRWQHYRKNAAHLVAEWDQTTIHRFNLDGAHNFWQQVMDNHTGKINTWAIFWYATIFARDGLCLNPTHSRVLNIGHDGSGTHCQADERFASKLPSEGWVTLPASINHSVMAETAIKAFYRQQHSPAARWRQLRRQFTRIWAR